jgi:hypothetical protein
MFVTITINLMDKVDKLISIIRQLHEDGMSAGASTTNSTAGAPGFSALSPAGGPTAGTTNPMSGMQRRGIIGKRKFPGARKRWKKPQP